jgi:UDP-N-acetylbacillosamine N-acetyltransferase
MSDNLISLIGAGGHSRVVIELLRYHYYAVTGIYDDSYFEGIEETIMGVGIVGKLADASGPMVLAMGNNAERKNFYEQHLDRVIQKNILHPKAYFETTTRMGFSNIVMANAYANSMATFGNNNIINTGSIVEHECKIGSHNHISIGAVVGGRVTIGDTCFIGARAVVKDQVSICDDVIVGAGGVVIKDITEPGTYVGNPVRKVK